MKYPHIAIPSLKASDIVVVVGSGPSLTAEQAGQVEASGAVIFCANDAYRMFDEVDMVVAMDPAWWRYHYELVRRHFRRFLCPDLLSIENGGHEYGVENCPSQPGNAWPQVGGPVYRGSNSGFLATQIAIASGAGRIVLLGMDCRADGDRNHFFGEHPACMPVPQHYDIWMEDWRALSVAPRPDRKPIQQLWDATPGGFINTFTMIPYVQLDVALFRDDEEERRLQRQIELCHK